jgi:cysteine sulfinate desulfinase/cysteine desulfurase-like protein
MIYLDRGTTRLRPEAREAMLPFFDGVYGNPSGSTVLGAKPRRR